MTLGDWDMLSACGIVSSDDSAALLALAHALVMLVSWSSYMKNPMGTTARLEPSLASLLVNSIRPLKIWRFSRPSKLFFFQFVKLLAVHQHLVIQT
jgi:hypothetical protein